MNKLEKLKEYTFTEFKNSGQEWLVEHHLKVIEKELDFLLKHFPDADKESLELAIWLHDISYTQTLKKDLHQEISSEIAGKIMLNFEYTPEEIKPVQDIISTHSCNKNIPKNLEQKIFATADAMSTLNQNFFLLIAIHDNRNLEDYKVWAKKKLDKSFNDKIFFDFAKDKVRNNYETINNFLNINEK